MRLYGLTGREGNTLPRSFFNFIKPATVCPTRHIILATPLRKRSAGKELYWDTPPVVSGLDSCRIPGTTTRSAHEFQFQTIFRYSIFGENEWTTKLMVIWLIRFYMRSEVHSVCMINSVLCLHPLPYFFACKYKIVLDLNY